MTNLITYEQKLYSQGIRYIAGLDEVGRGPLAGPFVVGAVILDLKKIFNALTNDPQSIYHKINDSKKVPEKRRREISQFVIKESISYSIIKVDAPDLDSMGLSKTTQFAFYEALQKLAIKPEYVLTDAFEIKKLTKESQQNIIGGDGKSITIAAASIIAKVYRDAIMVEMSKVYPHYGFENHKGYGTKQHLQAITEQGICQIHRKSYEPIKTLVAGGQLVAGS